MDLETEVKLSSELREISVSCLDENNMICNKLPSVGSLKERKYATKLRTTRNFSKLFG